MKKTSKLKFTATTIRQLDVAKLADVAGGWPTGPWNCTGAACPTGCCNSNAVSCPGHETFGSCTCPQQTCTC